MRIAVCGGVYSNPYALRAFVTDARARGAQRLYCLGDLGGYGAEPEAIWPLLTAGDVACIAGNYDVAIAQGEADCGCGYQDPRDREYAQLMFDYTVRHTSREFAAWMASLGTERRESLGGLAVHFVHGSPLALNDFWWESRTADAHTARVTASGADVVFCTHSGLPWVRRVDGRLAVNVGVIGRPPNDGRTDVRYAIADLSGDTAEAQIVSLRYDWQAQVRNMRGAGLPEAFIRTNEAGWWATCLEILPTEERSCGRYHVYDSSVPGLLDGAGLPESAWPDEDPAIPVRSLAGSPFLPSRIWLTTAALRTPALSACAAAAGFTDIRVLGITPEPSVRPFPGRPGLPLPELTVSRAGWHWHPAVLDQDPFLPSAERSGQAATDQTAVTPVLARQTAVRLLLETFYESGALSTSPTCSLAGWTRTR
jgi:diadenosine tetraphosphatase ApaH/serine/threonine PP2A family protein phosphatase